MNGHLLSVGRSSISLRVFYHSLFFFFTEMCLSVGYYCLDKHIHTQLHIQTHTWRYIFVMGVVGVKVDYVILWRMLTKVLIVRILPGKTL